MKKSICSWIVLLAMLMPAIRVFADTAPWDDASNYSSYSKGMGVVHMKIAARYVYASHGTFIGGAYGTTVKEYNITELDPFDSGSRLYYTITHKDGSKSTHVIAYLATFDWAHKASGNQVAKEAGDGWCVMTKMASGADAGVLTPTNCLLSKKYQKVTYAVGDKRMTVSTNDFTQNAVQYTGNGEKVFFECDWEMPAADSSYTIDLYLHQIIFAHVRDGVVRLIGGDRQHLGTYTNTQDAAPILAEPFFCPVDNDGNQLVGKVGITYSSTQKPQGYATYVNGVRKDSVATDQYGGLLFVDMADQEQNCYVNMRTFVKQSDTQTQLQKSNTITIKPYHQIHDFQVTPYVVDGVDKGYNRIRWELHHMKQPDLLENDVFVLTRATKSDFSDEAVVPSTTVIETLEQDTMVVEIIDSTCTTPMKYGQHYYYRVRRSSASVWAWGTMAANKGYQATDSIPCRVMQWSLYDGTDQSPLQYIYTPGKGAMVHINLCTPYDDQLYPINYRWDKNAQLTLTRHNLTTGESLSFDLIKDKRAVFSPCSKTAAHPEGGWAIKFPDTDMRPCCTYSYSVVLDTTGCLLRTKQDAVLSAISDNPFQVDDVAPNIRGLAAEQGVSKDYVLLTWEMDAQSLDSFVVERAWLHDTIMRYYRIGVTSQKAYKDYTAAPGMDCQYKYRLKGYYTCDNVVRTTDYTDAVMGWLDPYAVVSGYVQMPNGTGIAGVQVEVKHLPAAGVAGDSVVTRYIRTNEAGYFVCDSLPYGGDGSEYTVTPQHAELNFINTQSGNAVATLTFAPHAAEKHGYIFRTNNGHINISGRVLYHKTSVPVAYAGFQIQMDSLTAPAYDMKSASGAPVKTDLNGYFNLQVPKNMRTLRVQMENHEFLHDGYLMINGSRNLVLTEDLADIRFYDSTRVHVFGRVAGGSIQGAYSLGNDSSQNILGDSIVLVLELEGDKVSWLINDPNDLSCTQVDTLIQHVRRDGQAPGQTDKPHATRATTTRRRITIHPDNLSGEWRMDLLPVRYRIVQMYAKGYSSLLPVDEAMPILDLTDYAGDTAEHNYIYRSQPVLKYTQQYYGIDRAYFGVESVHMINLDQTYTLVKTAYVDSATQQMKYVFGQPLFSTGTYQMKVCAFEPYYYNNDTTALLYESVPLSGTLHVYNGMNSEVDTLLRNLDAKGEAQFSFVANNTSFTLTGNQALRTLDMWLPYRGSQVEAKPLRGYVTGSRELPGAVTQKLGSIISPIKTLRDPYGAGSYAYIKEGTDFTATYSYTHDLTWGINLKITGGTSWENITGVDVMGVLVATGYKINLTLPALAFDVKFTTHDYRKYTYSFSTSEEISTSSSPDMFGADADVYIGTLTDWVYTKSQAIQMLDSYSYQVLKPQFEAGKAHMIAEGRDINGNIYYLAIIEAVQTGYSLPATYVLTQNHILGTLIPDLQRQRNALIKDMSMAADSAKAVACTMHHNVYVSKVPVGDKNFGESKYYTVYKDKSDNITNMSVDEVEQYNSLITQWRDVIKQNELVKQSALRAGYPFKSYHVSGGTRQSYSEQATAQEDRSHAWNASIAFDISGSRSNDKTTEMLVNKDSAFIHDTGIHLSLPGYNFSVGLGVLVPTPITQNNNLESNTHTREVGYVIAPGGGCSTTQSVYRVTNKVWNNAYSALRDTAFHLNNNYSSLSWHAKDDDNILAADFVFYQEGGVTCCPWEPADSTLFVTPKAALSQPTQKLFEPKLALNIHEQSDVPADEAAVFTLTLSNESETESGKLGNFVLYVEDATNPNGLQVLIDGKPINDGRTFTLACGQSITKVMQVKRGVGYDFENIELGFISECEDGMSSSKRRKDFEHFSVHFRPVASPVAITAPDDKWVLNTLSPRDEDGYYLPVTISGYDLNYDGFDHIEMQYKLSTEGDKQWVNLCSFYANADLMAKATGNRQLITSSGKIEGFRFRGERDPIEQHYDLRAVSYSRYGNGYITRASDVISGIKDTRVPTQFGKAEPTNGILTFEDDIVINFSEPVAGQYLDKDNNFQVLGTTNSINLETSTSLTFPGAKTTEVKSVAERSLYETPFTIDLMVKTPEDNQDGRLFVLHEEGAQTEQVLLKLKHDDNSLFGKLHVQIGNRQWQSAPLESTLANFSRIIMVYDTADNGTVSFYQGNKPLTAVENSLLGNLHHEMTGLIVLGEMFTGNMMEVRLWKKALTPAEIGRTALVRLTGIEPGLVAYYPLNEGKGLTAKDLAHGNHLHIEGASWLMPEGHSMHLTDATISQQIKPSLSDQLVSANDAADYTLMMWWRADDHNQLATDTVALFATGNGRTDQRLFIGIENGLMTVRGAGQTLQSEYVVADDNWHHLTMTVNRAENLVNLYTDENLVAQMSATGFPGLSGTPYLGYCDNFRYDSATHALREGNHYWFRGHIDHFSQWSSALPTDFIALYANQAPSGEEIALNAYLKFHRKQLNDNGIYEVVPSIFNERCKRDPETGTIVVQANENRDSLLIIPASQVAAIWDNADCAPVLEPQRLTKLNYQYKTKDDQLMIELTNIEKSINKQRAYITVRAVEDLNGNPLESAITLPVYIDLNRIRWNEYGLDVEIEQGQTAVLDARILNRCGSIKQFTIATEDRWLTASTVTGQLQPKEERKIQLTVSDGLTPGTYTTFAYVTDESDLCEPLMINIQVKASEPDWEIDKSDAATTASLIADVKIQNGTSGFVYDTDDRDIVAAFAGNQCLGKAHISVSQAGRAQVYLTLYGSSLLQQSQLRLYLWQASTGRIYPLRDANNEGRAFIFTENACFGCDSLLTLRTVADDNIQMIQLKKGWNWVSTYLKVDADNADLNSTIITRSIFSDNDIIKTTANGGAFTEYHSGSWYIDQSTKLRTISHENVYQIRCQKGGKMELVGGYLNPSARVVQVGGGKWCQLPYLCETTQSVTDAMTSYFDYAQQGDIIKNYDQFAVFTADKRWMGSLEYMRPGEGYYMLSHAGTPVEVRFVNLDKQFSTTHSAEPIRQVPYAYSTSMPIVAQVSGIQLQPADEIRAFDADECVGVAVEAEGRLFLMTHAAEGHVLNFGLFRDGVQIATATTAICYNAAAAHGTVEQPAILEFVPNTDGAYKVLIDSHIYIVRDGLWYHTDGTRVDAQR